jgi:hypothetical protein
MSVELLVDGQKIVGEANELLIDLLHGLRQQQRQLHDA